MSGQASRAQAVPFVAATMDSEPAPPVDRDLHARTDHRLRPEVDPRHAAILARARAIPEGWVRTYGDLSPGAPRLTGTVLRGAGDPALPWHRVVRADGSLAKGERQRVLLEAEGVPFDAHGRVELRVARLRSEHVDPA